MKLNQLLAGALAFSLGLSGEVPAQDPKMEAPSMRLDVSPADSSLLRAVRPAALPRDLELSTAARANFRPMVQMADGRDIKVPLALEFRVSDDRKTLLQLGDPLFRMHPQRLDLFWIGDDGEIAQQVTNEFDGRSQASLSADGFLAVAGGAFLSEIPQDEAKPKRVRLYNSRGKILAETGVEAELDITQLAPMLEGLGVIYATAPSDRPLQDNRLYVLQKEQAQEIDASALGILQKVLVLNSELALVQGSQAFALVDLIGGEIRWQQPVRIRLIGPKAAALSEDGQKVLIMTGERVSSAAIYRWTMSVLEIETGRTLGQSKIDGEAAATTEQVFAEVFADGALVRFGEEARRISFK